MEMDGLFENENNYYYHISDSYNNEDVGVWNTTICSSDSSTKEIDSSVQNSYESKPLMNDFKYSYCSHRQNIPKEIQYPSSEITPFPRVVKKRNTANKKERRRTQSINTAFSSLRNKIPNVPVDTKLSKIKTLRLATSYILYLTRVLEGNQDPSNGFQAELITSLKLGKAEKKQLAKVNHEFAIEQEMKYKKNSGRTGWPQDVWASELKQEGRQLN